MSNPWLARTSASGQKRPAPDGPATTGLQSVPQKPRTLQVSSVLRAHQQAKDKDKDTVTPVTPRRSAATSGGDSDGCEVVESDKDSAEAAAALWAAAAASRRSRRPPSEQPQLVESSEGEGATPQPASAGIAVTNGARPPGPLPVGQLGRGGGAATPAKAPPAKAAPAKTKAPPTKARPPQKPAASAPSFTSDQGRGPAPVGRQPQRLTLGLPQSKSVKNFVTDLHEKLELVARKGTITDYSRVLALVVRFDIEFDVRFYTKLLVRLLERMPPPAEMMRLTLNLALGKDWPVIPASLSQPTQRSLDGAWESKGEGLDDMVMIENGKVWWESTKTVGDIAAVEGNIVVMSLQGDRHRAQLSGHQLHWDDGDVWVRADVLSTDQLERLRGRVRSASPEAEVYYGHFASLLHLEALSELQDVVDRLGQPAMELARRGWAILGLEVTDLQNKEKKKSKPGSLPGKQSTGRKCTVVFAVQPGVDWSRLRLSPGDCVLLSREGPLWDLHAEGLVSEISPGMRHGKPSVMVTFDSSLEASVLGEGRWRLDRGPNRTAHERQFTALLRLAMTHPPQKPWDLLLSQQLDLPCTSGKKPVEPGKLQPQAEPETDGVKEEVMGTPELEEPLLQWEGREFSGTPEDFHNLADDVLPSGLELDGACSIAFDATWLSLNRWSRAVDFGDGEEKGNVFIGNKGKTGTLVFHVWVGKKEFSLHMQDVLRVGETHRYLFTVSTSGFMRVFQDGSLIGEKFDGMAPQKEDRRRLYVGKSNWDRDEPFHGSVRNLMVWAKAIGPDGAQMPKVRHEPAIFYDGRDYEGDQNDWDDLGSRFDAVLGGERGFSIAFSARWDSLKKWSRIIDWGNGPGVSMGYNIIVANQNERTTLVFSYWNGQSEYRLLVPDAIEVGVMHRYLCTVGPRGHMRVNRDGQLIGEMGTGVPLPKAARNFLYVAKSHWEWDDAFHGAIQDLKAWRSVVDWDGCSEDAAAFKVASLGLQKAAAQEPVLSSLHARQRLDMLRAGLMENEGPDATSTTLNASQREAVAAALGRTLTLIQGPPGTGKTHVSVNLLWYWAKDLGLRPLLAASDSNIAVDNIAEGALAAGLNVVRVGRPEKVTAKLESAMLDVKVRQSRDNSSGSASDWWGDSGYGGENGTAWGRSDTRDWGKDDHAAKMAVLKDADLICTTTVGAGSDLLISVHPEAILIDEAAQATEPSAAVPLVLRGAPRLVLVGDHCQLAPSVRSSEAQARGLPLSLFQRFVDGGLQPFFLDTQFRMHPQIAAFSARDFYDGRLQTGVCDFERPAPSGFSWPSELGGVAFVKVASPEVAEGESKTNPREADVVVRLLSAVLRQRELGVLEVGVVSPYAAQVRLLRERLRSWDWRRRMLAAKVDLNGGLSGRAAQNALEIASVDAFQGREKELIIFSAVRSNPQGNVGFLADWRRLNVMLTRAKRGLIVVGDPNTLKKDPKWASWLDWAWQNHFWASPAHEQWSW